MAGPFGGVLLGTIGTQPGASNMSPFIAMRQAQIQAEMDYARQQQQQGQFDAQMRMQGVENLLREKIADKDFQLKTAELAQRGALGEQELDVRRAEGERRSQQERDELGFKREAFDWEKELTAKKEQQAATEKKENEDLLGFQTRIRSVVADRAGRIGYGLGPGSGNVEATPEAIRDSLLREMETVAGMTPREKAIAAEEVDRWYQQESKARRMRAEESEKQRQAREREADRDLDRKIREEDLALRRAARTEQEARQREQAASEAAQKASAPMRKEQAQVRKTMTDLEGKLALAQGYLDRATTEQQKATYGNMVAGLTAALKRMQDQWATLEAAANAKETEARNKFSAPAAR